MHRQADTECDTCPLGHAVERREFLRRALTSAVGAMGTLPILANAASALTIEDVSGSGLRSAKRYPLPAVDGVAIDKEESVIVARFDGRAYAFSLACPHQNTALRWDSKAGRFQCPKHKSRYQPNGVFIEGRATRGLDRFAVTLEDDVLVVDLDRLYREDKNPTEWKGAMVTLPSKEK